MGDPLQARRSSELMGREGARLTRRDDQVLEYSEILADRRWAVSARVDSIELVVDALTECLPAMNERLARVDLLLAPALPCLEADSDALRCALVNLVMNALKHGGERPWIGVSARLEDPPWPGTARLILEVVDRGPGIPPEDLERIFEPRYRSAAAREGQIAGSGLGLALVRHVAREHGGAVNATNRPGAGVAFTMSIPVVQTTSNDDQNPAD